MKSDIVVENSRATAEEYPDHNLENEIKILDKAIERLEVGAGDMAQMKIEYIPERSFWDELIDVNCTPQGQDYRDPHGTWDRLLSAWLITGAYLSEAMHLQKDRGK